jgi:hypothetical protein
MPKPRRCTGKTKAGKRCKAYALHGTKPPRCLAHADEKERERLRFGGAQPGAGRPAKPRPSAVARKLIEENTAAVLRPYWLTLGYDVEATGEGLKLVAVEGGGAKLHTTGSGRVRVSAHADLEAMMRAAERLQDRVYGKPKQTVDVDLDADNREPEEIDAGLAALTEQAFRDAAVPGDVIDNVLPELPA